MPNSERVVGKEISPLAEHKSTSKRDARSLLGGRDIWHLYTVSQKGNILLVPITSPNVDRF